VREFTSKSLRVLPCDRVVTSPDVLRCLLHRTYRRLNDPAHLPGPRARS
jgi:hypothetical protein